MIYLDARMIESSGIGTYIKNISLKSNVYDIYLGDKKQLKKYFSNNKLIEYTPKIYGIKEQIQFPYNKIPKNSILHCPHYNIPLFYTGKLVVTIHDITHILFPEYLPNKLALYYAKFMMWTAIKKSKHILVDSENTKNDLTRIFKVPQNKMTVTFCGVDKYFKVVDKIKFGYLYNKYEINKNKKVILYVGNKKPHKNLERLLKAFSISKFKENSQLIFTGKGFDTYKRLDEVAKKLNLENYIIHTGIVPDEELVYLYNMADVFVFPSLYEGFGIPPLEAMACGTPVVASNCSSIPEVVGDAAYLVDPYSIKDISKGIDKVLGNEDFRDKLVQKGFDRVKLFDWKDSILTIENVFKEIDNSN